MILFINNSNNSFNLSPRSFSFSHYSYYSRILIIENNEFGNRYYMYNKSFSRAKLLFRKTKIGNIICNNYNSICLSNWHIYEIIKNILY
jgi:hypothetical protein